MNQVNYKDFNYYLDLTNIILDEKLKLFYDRMRQIFSAYFWWGHMAVNQVFQQ